MIRDSDFSGPWPVRAGHILADPKLVGMPRGTKHGVDEVQRVLANRFTDIWAMKGTDVRGEWWGSAMRVRRREGMAGRHCEPWMWWTVSLEKVWTVNVEVSIDRAAGTA